MQHDTRLQSAYGYHAYQSQAVHPLDIHAIFAQGRHQVCHSRLRRGNRQAVAGHDDDLLRQRQRLRAIIGSECSLLVGMPSAAGQLTEG